MEIVLWGSHLLTKVGGGVGPLGPLTMEIDKTLLRSSQRATDLHQCDLARGRAKWRHQVDKALLRSSQKATDLHQCDLARVRAKWAVPLLMLVMCS